jgi:hypothetical protein
MYAKKTATVVAGATSGKGCGLAAARPPSYLKIYISVISSILKGYHGES